jgi:hypothetical protein
MTTTLARFQPADDDSSAAIGTAIDAIAAEQASLVEKIDSLREERSTLLRTGTIKTVVAVEAQMREAEIGLERLAIVAADLETRRAAAHVAERSVALEAKRQATVATIEAANLWWQTEYPRLAGAIADGLRQCYGAEFATWEFHNAAAAAGRAGGEITSMALPTPPRTSFAPYGAVPPHRCTQLPPAATGPAVWWPADLLGRPRHPGG